ncbi:MAG TPA: DUF6686 family protein [Ohtaekwangia sp.]|nr:DUF6686 family protein [Ohtaekwangia sp.]
MKTGNEGHSQSSFRIISETAHGYIGKCECCHQYNFVFNNLLISFLEDELINFLDWLQGSRYSNDTCISLYNGRDRVYTSLHSNLFLTFSDGELNDIEQMTVEVKLMIEASHALRRIG